LVSLIGDLVELRLPSLHLCACCCRLCAVAPASEVLRDRSEPQISTSWRMNDDLAALRSVKS
jgi:hypothetical protein